MPSFMPIELKLWALEGYTQTDRQTNKQTDRQSVFNYMYSHFFFLHVNDNFIIFVFCFLFFSEMITVNLYTRLSSINQC